MFNVRSYKLVSDQVDYLELAVIMRELEKVLQNNASGAVVELGCYKGTTSLFMQRLLRQHGDIREFHVYDSFNGLPEKSYEDSSITGEQFGAGELCVSKKQLVTNFKQAGLPLPIIHKKWFSDLLPEDIPEEIAFAFLDGDFYESIRDSLNAIRPFLSKSSVIVVDDYQSEALPGVQLAVDEWATKYKISVRAEKSLAIVKWQF